MNHNRMRVLSVIIVLFFSSAWTSQFHNKLDSAVKTLKVGVLYWSMNIPGQVAMRRGLEREAYRINAMARKNRQPSVQLLKNVAGDGSEGIKNQIIQMEKLVAAKVDLIIVQPTDNAALSKPLRMANKAGIPVIAYDQYISGGKLASYITSDNYQAGFLDGEYVASHFSNTKKLKIILVEYPHVSSTVERVNGFLDALKKYGQSYKILKTYIAVEPKTGKKAGRQIVSDFPAKGSVDVVFTVNDGGGVSVAYELMKAGRYEIFQATIDGDPESVRIIKRRGVIRVDSAQFCGALGRQAMIYAYALLNKRNVPRHVLIPVFPITRETFFRYGGWLKPIPGRFKKPWKSENVFWKGELKVLKP